MEEKIVLIVEDDPVLANMYSEKFRSKGITTIIAPDGKTGLELALQKTPNIILLDIRLPNFSGISMLTELRKDQRGLNIPVIALSNYADKENAQKALELGVKEYLIKAMYTPEKVVAKVNKYLLPNPAPRSSQKPLE